MKTFAALLLALGLLTSCGSSEPDVPTVGPTSDAAQVESPMEEAEVIEEVEILEDEPASDMPAFSNVPDDWPADMPVPEGGELQAWTMPFDNDIRASWRIEGSSVFDVGSAYNDALSSLNFNESEYLGEENKATGSYASAERTVTFEVNPTDDGAVSVYVVHQFIQE
jgi:hypothetical protein